jgi:hypothetical protein
MRKELCFKCRLGKQKNQIPSINCSISLNYFSIKNLDAAWHFLLSHLWINLAFIKDLWVFNISNVASSIPCNTRLYINERSFNLPRAYEKVGLSCISHALHVESVASSLPRPPPRRWKSQDRGEKR